DHGRAVLLAEFDDGVVQRIGRGRDSDIFDQRGFLEAMDDVPEKRLAGDGLQHLAGQARRAHAGLDNRNNPQVLGVAQATDSHTARTWRSGRMPSVGSARHSRSESSEGCGPLKPVPSATSDSLMRAMTGAISSGSQQWPAAYSAPLPSRSRWNSTQVAPQRCTARSITAGLRV